MNEKTSQGESYDRDDETMQRLLRLAGPRAPVPGDIEERVYERVRREWEVSSRQPESGRVYSKVHREWQRRNSRRRFRRWAYPAALAATLLLAVAVVTQSPPPAPPPAAIGEVVRVSGNGSSAAPGDRIHVGDRLSTAAGQRLSLSLQDAESLRLDENTMLVVDAADRFTLLQGRIYADTGDFIYRKHAIVVDTSLGSVADVGTQFAVAVGQDSLDVAVREGRVDVSRDSTEFVAVAGERLRLEGNDEATIDRLAPHDAFWDWAAAIAPTFDIENESLLEFLRWAARETGRELEFEDNELRLSAMRTDLHGSVADFEPLEAVESVLATTKFGYRIEPARIVISR